MAEEVVLHAGGGGRGQGKTLGLLFLLSVILTLIAGLVIFYFGSSIPAAMV